MTPQKRARIFIIAASALVLLAIGLIYIMPKFESEHQGLRQFLNQLPLINTLINLSTTVVLIFAYVAIRKRNIALHRALMTTAVALAVLFLLFYVSYHSTTESTKFPSDNPLRSLYIFILLSHILLSAAVVPLVLITYTRALSERYDKHKKIARITLPVWLYVSITGVIVYLMISPYYNF